MLVPDQVLELFSDVLAGRKTDAAILSRLCQGHVPEGPYHEYKRGKWFDQYGSWGLRRHLSGFANAEGGVLILGIVGGEDSQGQDKWTFEAPMPPAEGWNVWIPKALQEVAAKARIAWQVVPVDGHDLVVIAANRAEALMRVQHKSTFDCYLRVGEHTHKIPETLFADLALGRRAKPDLTVEGLKVTDGGVDMYGFHVNVEVSVHNEGLLWTPDMVVSWTGYAGRGTPAPTSLLRQLALRTPRAGDATPTVVVGSFNPWDRTINGWMSSHHPKPVEVRPFEAGRFAGRIDGIPITVNHGSWAWFGAIVAVPKDNLPLWAQLQIQGKGTATTIAKARALPPGAPPVVAWFDGPDVPRDIEEFLRGGGT